MLQECDNGAAAKDVLLRLGLPGLHPSIVGGASFTHGWWDRNFLQIHNGLWGAGLKYTAVTLVWAGISDLTSRWTTRETLTDAVADLKAFGEWYGIPIRLIDVVVERYTEF